MIRESWTFDFRRRHEPVDLLIFAIGYERRSAELPRKLNAIKRIGVRLPGENLLNHQANLSEARARGDQIAEGIDDLFQSLASAVEEMTKNVRIMVDISSMPRSLIFQILYRSAKILRMKDSISFVYTPSLFKKPEMDFPEIRSLGPVCSWCVPFDADLSRGTALILGAGFEPGLATGIISQIEPETGYYFWGVGVDKRYDAEIISDISQHDFKSYAIKVRKYDIFDPINLYETIDSIVYDLAREYIPTFILLGPKIFSFVCALISIQYAGNVATWRVEHTQLEPRDAVGKNLSVVMEIDIERLSRHSMAIPI